MKILVVGAGAVGGYFGGRLAEKGEDVSFLVRQSRKTQLAQTGLVIKSGHGNVTIQPKTLVAGEEISPFDIIIVSTKSYHLDQAIQDIRPYVHEETLILPLLNGMSHMDRLSAAFNEKNILGGLCFIESTLDEDGAIIQTSQMHELVFGERDSKKSERIIQLQTVFKGTKANFRLSDHIDQDMWHKYLFISTLSGVTSLFRSPIGPIRESDLGLKAIKQVTAEAAAIIRKLNAPIAENIEDLQLSKLHQLSYEMKSSLQRDMEKKLSIEADHLYGYLLDTAEREKLNVPALTMVYTNLKVYEKNQL